MQIDQELLKLVDRWTHDVLENGLTEFKLAKLAKITRHQARRVVSAIQGLNTALAQPGTSATPKKNEGQSWLADGSYIYNEATDTYITWLRSSPAPLVVNGQRHRDLIKAYSNWDGGPATLNEMCRTFEIPRPWLVEYLRKHGVTHDREPFSAEEVMGRDTEELVEEALQHRRAALHQRYEKAKWHEVQKDADKWRAFDQSVLQHLSNHMAEERANPRTARPVIMRKAEERYAFLVSPTDFHWGMRSWAGEVGQAAAYNREIAEERLFRHTENLVARLPGRPEKIIVTIGSDFFHIDGQLNATTRGTPMDTDGSPTEILVTGCDLNVKYIEALAQVAPVEVVLMSGNHDAHNGRALLLYLSAWFRDDARVFVRREFTKRVYLRYGAVGCVFEHGDTTKVKDLGIIFAVEGSEVWSATKHHVAFGGHLHHHKVHEIGGVVHYLNPSLAGSDRWHSESGYVLSSPALVGYVLDYEHGVTSWMQSRE